MIDLDVRDNELRYRIMNLQRSKVHCARSHAYVWKSISDQTIPWTTSGSASVHEAFSCPDCDAMDDELTALRKERDDLADARVVARAMQHESLR